jgi:hypothetical protein
MKNSRVQDERGWFLYCGDGNFTVTGASLREANPLYS